MERENFDYLLGMTMWSLTKEKKDDLLRQRDEKIAELKRLQARTPISLWKEDLENLLNELNKVKRSRFFYEMENNCVIVLLVLIASLICGFFACSWKRKNGRKRTKQSKPLRSRPRSSTKEKTLVV